MIKDFNRVPLMMAENQGTKNPFKRLIIWLKNKMQPKPKEEIKGSQTPLHDQKGKSDENQADVIKVDKKTTTTEKIKSAQQTIAGNIANEALRKSSLLHDETPKQVMDGKENSIHKQTEPAHSIKSIESGTPPPPPLGTPPPPPLGTPPPPPPIDGLNERPQPGAWKPGALKMQMNKPKQETTTNEPKNQTDVKSATPKPQGIAFDLNGPKVQRKEIVQKTPEEIAASQKASMERAAEAKKLKRSASENTPSENTTKNTKTEPISKSASADDLNKNSKIETDLPSFKARQAAISKNLAEQFGKTGSKVEQDAKNKETRRSNKIEK